MWLNDNILNIYISNLKLRILFRLSGFLTVCFNSSNKRKHNMVYKINFSKIHNTTTLPFDDEFYLPYCITYNVSFFLYKKPQLNEVLILFMNVNFLNLNRLEGTFLYNLLLKWKVLPTQSFLKVNIQWQPWDMGLLKYRK